MNIEINIRNGPDVDDYSWIDGSLADEKLKSGLRRVVRRSVFGYGIAVLIFIAATFISVVLTSGLARILCVIFGLCTPFVILGFSANLRRFRAVNRGVFKWRMGVVEKVHHVTPGHHDTSYVIVDGQHVNGWVPPDYLGRTIYVVKSEATLRHTSVYYDAVY